MHHNGNAPVQLQKPADDADIDPKLAAQLDTNRLKLIQVCVGCSNADMAVSLSR